MAQYKRKYPHLQYTGDGHKTDDLVDAIRELNKNGINEKDLNRVIISGMLTMLQGSGIGADGVEEIVSFALNK